MILFLYAVNYCKLIIKIYNFKKSKQCLLSVLTLIWAVKNQSLVLWWEQLIKIIPILYLIEMSIVKELVTAYTITVALLLNQELKFMIDI